MKLRRRVSIRPRFTLAALLVLITVVAIPLSYIAEARARNLRRSKAYQVLREKGVDFHFQPASATKMAPRMPLGALWGYLTAANPNELVSTIAIGGYGNTGGNTSVTDEDLKDLVYFPETLQVNVTNVLNVTDRGLEVLDQCPKLFCLNLTSSPKITGAFLEKLGPLPPLRTINLTDMEEFDGKHLAAIERFSDDSVMLYINGCKKINDETTQSVALPKNVGFLYLRCSSLGDGGLSNWLTRAKFWGLEIDAPITSRIAPALATQTKLTSLTIKNAPLSDADLAFLSKCKNLRRLTLIGLPIHGDFLQSLPSDALLEELCLNYSLLSDKNAVEIFRFTKLQQVGLEYTTLSGDFTKEASPSNALQAIHLCGVQFSESGKATFLNFAGPNLQISMPQNWSVEDLRRFPGGKSPFALVYLSAAHEPKNKSVALPPNISWYAPDQAAAPVNRSPGRVMEPILRLLESAKGQEQ